VENFINIDIYAPIPNSTVCDDYQYGSAA